MITCPVKTLATGLLDFPGLVSVQAKLGNVTALKSFIFFFLFVLTVQKANKTELSLVP